MLLPLLFRGAPIGFLTLGPKRSGHPFDSDDIHLLRTLANQTAIAIVNARSYNALEDITQTLDEKVRQRTEELRISNEQLRGAYDELQQAQAQLVHSEKMASLGQLVAGVAHELNNPASFVHGGLANLEEYVKRFEEVIRAYEEVPIHDPQQAQCIADLRVRTQLEYLLRETPELLGICTEGSERIKRIVDDLRVFARAEPGERAPTDLVDGIESTLRLLADRLDRAAVSVVRDYHPLPPIAANAGQLSQLWTNLLTNALDAVEARPAPRIGITVRLQPDGVPAASPGVAPTTASDWVEVAIDDNGTGIDRETIDRIFEPFFTTKPIGKGTGLGLAIAYGAAKSHGGTIVVESEPGRGTRVRVRLPVAARLVGHARAR